MKYLAALILSGLFFSFAQAEDAKEDKLAKALEKYTKTGKVERCVNLRRIRSTKVVDDQHIIFKMSGKKAYLNTLTHKCPRLGFEKSFSYKTSISQLCNVDIITVLDTSMGMSGPSCGLGKFEELVKKPKKK